MDTNTFIRARDPRHQGRVDWLVTFVAGDKPEPCRYGHGACSIYEGGPCAAEARATLTGLVDDEGRALLNQENMP
jgi:hypothetical protein